MTVTAAQARIRPTMNPRRYFGTAWRHPFARAVLKALLTVWVATTITFFLIRLLPGSPVDIKIDELITTSNGALTYEDARSIASSLFAIDLDAPLHEQYISFISNVARGDLGYSFLSSGTSVMSIILGVLPWTLFAVGTGLLLSFIVGIGLGLVATSPTPPAATSTR
jgi:peptide/nickel transport system permease protein